MELPPLQPEGIPCPVCSTRIAPALLCCPACKHLVHTDRLKQLAAGAAQARQSGEASRELGLWREALELLPQNSGQSQTILVRMNELSGQLDALPSAPSKSPAGMGAMGWGIAGILFFILGKAKFLLLGLSKAGTFFSMLLAFGVYWTIWGWKFALGFVLSIYIHEMGHVAALRHFGIKATVPMFIPGFGAMIRLRQYPTHAIENARVGLAGPLWGAGAAVMAGLIYIATSEPYWAAIAHVGAWINLFNLTPVWQLDGDHAFRALTRSDRWVVCALLVAMFALTHEGLLILVLLFAGFQAFQKENVPVNSDLKTRLQYAFLVILLSMMCLIPVPTPG